ncbi:hypothetical protein O1L60_46430 [Streptomyces diastatochromogenes]|nr:hypothetical protein [Streptomyces diastatochromogenes]
MGLDPRSKAGFDAYADRFHPVEELWPFAGESPESMLRQMRREQSAWAMMIRCMKVFGAAQSRFGPQAEAWARDCSARVLHALIDEVHGVHRRPLRTAWSPWWPRPPVSNSARTRSR